LRSKALCEYAVITTIITLPIHVYNAGNLSQMGSEDGEEEESWDTLLLDDGDDEEIDQDMFC
jgi:hypothetical protein